MVEPEGLAKARRYVRSVTNASESLDRRGFRLLQWPSPRTDRKPIELSLEHEARMKPRGPTGLFALLSRLMLSEGRSAADILLNGSAGFGGLTVTRVQRRPGPQSVDIYFDFPQGGFVSAGYTFRLRKAGRQFMTWDQAGDGLSALNLELPAVDMQRNAITARLEFNWLDSADSALAKTDADAAGAREPVPLVAKFAGLDLRALVPAFENTTTRQKFSLVRGAAAAFALNVDLITTRDLRRNTDARFVDVDVSSVNVIDEGEIDALAALSGRLMETYDLEFRMETKASAARRVLGAP